mgnify:CR=1 FL=1
MSPSIVTSKNGLPRYVSPESTIVHSCSFSSFRCGSNPLLNVTQVILLDCESNMMFSYIKMIVGEGAKAPSVLITYDELEVVRPRASNVVFPIQPHEHS